MNKKITYLCLGLNLFIQSAAPAVQVYSVKGEISVRRGLEENWIPACAGINLDEIDTILSEEASEVVLILEDGSRFTMGANAILDISDLQVITERQLFLYLMSEKIGRLNIHSPDKIHISNVSVVRGTQVHVQNTGPVSGQNQNWKKELNGAKALIGSSLFTNAIMKLYKIIQRYPDMEDEGELHFLLGRSFEAIEETGRAYEVYQTAMDQVDVAGSNPGVLERKMQIQAALDRLKSGLSKNQ